MSREEFEAFLTKHSKVPEINWSSRLMSWKDAIDDFYTQVDSFLAPYVSDGRVSIKYADKRMFEDHVGQYESRYATITIGTNSVRLDPVGTIVVGALGRIDMIGPGGIAKFVLVDRGVVEPSMEEERNTTPTWEWRIATMQPRIKFLPLNEDSFYSSLMEVAHG